MFCFQGRARCFVATLAFLPAAAGVERVIASSGTIAEVDILGNQAVEKEAILSAVRAKKGTPYSRSTLTRDLKAVWGLGLFDDIKIDASETDAGWSIVFIVREKPVIREIRYEGNRHFKVEKLNEAVSVKPRHILNLDKIKRSVQDVKKLYQEDNYYLANVDYQIEEHGTDEVDLIFEIDEQEKVQVKQIEFIGNKVFSDVELRGHIQTQEVSLFGFLKKAGTYREELFLNDVNFLNIFYWDHGYVEVRIEKPRVFLLPDKRSIALTMVIHEGEKFDIGSIDVAGDLIFPKVDLKRLLKTRAGQQFSYSNLRDDVTALTDKYSDIGYAFADVTYNTRVDHEKRTVDLVYDIHKGNIVHFGEIVISGNTKTRDKVIRREISFAEGDLFSGVRLRESRLNIQRLGFFEDVALSTPKGQAADELDVQLNVRERQTGTFTVGAGFSSNENFLATVQISQNNFLGYGQTVAISAELSSVRQRYNLSFLDEHFLDTNWTFGADLFNSTRIFSDFTLHDKGGGLSLGHTLFDLPFGDAWQRMTRNMWIRFRYEIDDTTTSNFSSSVSNLFEDGLTSSVTTTVFRDTRNDRWYPTNGTYNAMSVQVAGGPFGGDFDFLQGTYNTRLYIPLFFNSVLKFNVKGGYLTSIGTGAVPIHERYFLGGINDIRGFELRSISPFVRVLSDDPSGPDSQFLTGGNKELIANIELEFPLLKQAQIRGVFFHDRGNSYGEGQPFDPLNTRESWGFGIRWNSPIGPLRFEWGFPLDRRVGESHSQFEFTFGNLF